MEIIKNANGPSLVIAVKGCLDTTTSPELQTVLEGSLDGVADLLVDFTDLEYISSAGFRVLLVANKKMLAAGGKMSVKGVSPAVREVFDMTGFSDIFDLV